MGEIIQVNFSERQTDPSIDLLCASVLAQVKETAKTLECPDYAALIAGQVLSRMATFIYSELSDEAADILIDMALQEWAWTEAP